MSGWHSLSGLLYSKPTGAFSRFKSKRPQYYVFEESKCQLHFYKDKHEAAQKDKEPLGTINVRGASITLHFEEPNSFVINSDSKEFILQAENHESMMIWLLALQANRDAFASRELKPENSRMSKQLALAHKRRFSDNTDRHYSWTRESAPDVSGSFNGSSSLGSIPGRMPAGGAAAGGRRMPRMSTLDQTSSMMTRSAIEEEDEITKDWVDCEFLPEVAGAVGLPSSPPSPEPLTDHSGSNGVPPVIRKVQDAAAGFGSRLGLSLSQSFTSGVARTGGGRRSGGLDDDEDLDDEDSGGSDAEAFNYDSLVDESPKRRAAYAGGGSGSGGAQALQDGANGGSGKPRSEDSGIDSSNKDARNLLSQSDDSLLDPSNRVHDLEQELIKCKKELAELMNRDTALKEVLKKRDAQIAELDMKLSRLEHLESEHQEKGTMRNRSTALPSFKSESAMRDWVTAKSADLKQLEEQCRILQNNNRFLNNEVKKLTNLRQMELEKFKNQDRIYREQKLEIENWKRDYLFLLQSCITVPTGDVSDGFELNVHGGHRHRERLTELLEDARTVNPRLPTFESLTASECHVDSFGFKHSHENESLLLHYICRQLHEHYTSLLDRWEQHQRQWKTFISTCRSYTKTKELKGLVRNGIPRMFRSAVWRELVHSHIQEIRAVKGRHYYTTLTQQIHDSEVAGMHRKQISLDLLRTMPTNIQFDSNDSEGIQKLQEILQAFCIHNPAIGYCQGMNFLAGMGLLFLSKEDTFWLLVAITEAYFHPLYFTSNLIGAQADQLVLKDLLKSHLPELHRHLEELEIDISTVTLNWFLAVFFDAVPFPALLRIWDCFLLEGPKVLFRFTLGILKLHEKILLQQTDTISVWKHLKAAAKLTFDVEGLARAAFEELPGMAHRKDISVKQSCFINSLIEQDERRKKKRKAYNDTEERFREMETRSVDRPIIECGGSFLDGNTWICYGDQNRTRICKLQPEENLMYNLREEIDSRVMCVCALDASVVLLGTLNMYIIAFDTEAEERLWQCRIHDSVLDICASAASDRIANRVFAALANGSVAVLDHVGHEEPNNNIFYVNLSTSPLTSLLLVNTDLWVACGNYVQLLDAECLDPKEKFHVSNNPFDSILCLKRSRFGIWIAVRGSSVIELWDEDTLTCCLLYDVKELKYPIFRKDDETLFNPWRITSILPFEDSLWVGTGSGDLVVFTVSYISKKRVSSNHSDALKNQASAKRPDTLMTRSTVKEKVEKYLSAIDQPLTKAVLKKEASDESTPRASPYNSPAHARLAPRVHRMSRSCQTLSNHRKQIMVRKSQHDTEDPKVLDLRLDDEIVERDAFHLEIFLQMGAENTRVEVQDKATLTDPAMMAAEHQGPRRQDATDHRSITTDEESDNVFEDAKDSDSASRMDGRVAAPQGAATVAAEATVVTPEPSSPVSGQAAAAVQQSPCECFASAEETETPGSQPSRPSPFLTAASSNATALQPFENIVNPDQPYDYNLMLTVRNKVSESPIKCLILTKPGYRGDCYIISCSSRFGEDEAVLKWRRENQDQQIWTNEPIFEVNPITKIIQFPTYMAVRNRLGSNRSEHSAKPKDSSTCLTD
ncbi:hypothetical protein BOX15_Mlig002084g3 [Macrostomum lignano]|uniref:TBC1 domain family member 2B n=1 Tax=Macrostomum lignano TaxID=282301 RepID=A0A267H661_9PLAT|nr:hypothetical protein BOX15_Mlig002084g3 [Macrostomum lignano]